MVIVAPVEIVLKEISLVIVGPGESGIDSSRWQTEVRDWPWISFLHVIIFEDPVSVSCGKEKKHGAKSHLFHSQNQHSLADKLMFRYLLP